MGFLRYGTFPNASVPVWADFKIGAGGFISGIDIHSDGTKVMRTDTYNAYVRNTVWDQVVTTSSMPGGISGPDLSPFYDDSSLAKGVYEYRTAPSNSSRQYMVFNGYCYRTDNKGTTWTRTGRTQDINANPNDNDRGKSPSIAIDPQNADFVVVVTPAQFSWSADAGSTWTTFHTSKVPLPTSGGRPLVQFIPNSTVTSGKTQGIYVFSQGRGVYKSTDALSTASLVTSSSTTGSQMLCDAAGILWHVSDVSSAIGSLYKYTGSGSWPAATGAGTQVRAVAVNPSNGAQVQVVDAGGALTFSLNTGGTWTAASSYSFTATDIPWLDPYEAANSDFMSVGNSLVWAADGKLYIGFGLGVAYCTPPLTATAVVWNSMSDGIEQLVSNWCVSPWVSGSKVICAVWDQGVFSVSDPTTYPTTHGPTLDFAAAWAVDWASSNPACIVAKVNDHGNEKSGYSLDGGATWTVFGASPVAAGTQATGGSIAALTDLNFITVGSGDTSNKLLYTTDRGLHWNAGAFSGANTPLTTAASGWGTNYYWARQILCADRVNSVFYAHNDDGTNGSSGTMGIWKSTNGGANWTRYYTGTLLKQGYGSCQMRSVPGRGGEFCFTAGIYAPPHPGSESFYYCVDNGTSLSVNAVSGVKEVRSFGFGKAKPGGSGNPAVYIAGFVSSVYGIYRSDDFFDGGTPTWTALGDGFPNGVYDLVKTVEGDANTYNRCYVGFNGSGFKYWH